MIPRRRTQKEESAANGVAASPLDGSADPSSKAVAAKATRNTTAASSGRLLKLVLLGSLGIGCLWIVSNRTTLSPVAVTSEHEQASQSTTSSQSSSSSPPTKQADPWTFFNGDLNKFYNNLEKDIQRDANNIDNYAVHRWMGTKHSTYEHYYLMKRAIQTYHPAPRSTPKRVFDGGCGLGAGLMWFEREEPTWTLLGHTISQVQFDWIQHKLPPHKFEAKLKSFDDLDVQVDFIYSIEALLHSPNLTHTMEAWATHLDEGGIICVIDDFLAIGARRDDEEVAEFIKSWQAPSLVTPTEMALIAKQFGLEIREARDLNAEYQINEMHYRNELEAVVVSGDRTHQAWKGSKVRGRLMVTGKITYHMLVFQKPVREKATSGACKSVAKKMDGESGATFAEISPDVVIGDGLANTHQCNKGEEFYDKLTGNQTIQDRSFGNVKKELFRSYKTVFAGRLNGFYKTLSSTAAMGKFLALEKAGANFTSRNASALSGPLDYWTLNPDRKEGNNTLVCDVANCPDAQDCSFDVTFSLGVIEHFQHPSEAFDGIAQLTKEGGLALHVVPFIYPYHDESDNYRFSHTALQSVFEERGFSVLDVGYDICTNPKAMRRSDERDATWLTYIVARKK